MRKIWDFHGGIHPPENKDQSLGEPIAPAGIPRMLTLPVSQHIGAPAIPVVEPGDQVLKGQQIAKARGPVSVPVHAPTSGTVVAVEPRPVAHPSGLTALCVVIEPDGEDRWIEHAGLADYTAEDKAALLERIRDAGIAGMGGAGFPAAVKLAGRPGAEIDTLIINGTECEPYITADDILMRERADQIVAGTLILKHLIAPGHTLIGIEDNKPEAIAAVRRACQGHDIEVVQFPTKYPSGGEKQLIEILTGRQVPSGGLPADIGVVCQNLGTTVAIHRAIAHGEPLISRVTTVTGEAVDQPRNYDTLLGTPMAWLLERAGYRAADNNRLVMGGPMMGFTVTSADVPVVKTTNCVLAPTEAELPTPPPAQACIRCGMCAEACPASLLPQQLFWFAQGQEHEKLEQHNLFDCIECGACAYVCPSSIPLVQYYRAAKAEIVQLRQDHERANHSRDRFEARQARLEREAAEKEAKRAARKKAAEERAKKAAESGDAQEDPIQAAIERAKAKKAAQASAPAGDSRDKLEADVAATRKRLEKAEAKLAEAREADDANIAAYENAVQKTRDKLQNAEAALAAAPAPDAPAASSSGDAAQDAIARALAARYAAAELSPEEKARADLEKLEARLAKTRTKLEESRSAGEQDKVIEALESTVVRLEDKIATVRQSVGMPAEAEAKNQGQTTDPAALAIERAKARRAGTGKSSESPKEVLERNREALNKKLTTTRERLAEAREAGDDTVVAFEMAEAKLADKLARVERELAELEEA